MHMSATGLTANGKIQENGHKLRWQKSQNTGHWTRLLGFSPDYWALHPTTKLFTRLLIVSPDYWETYYFLHTHGVAETNSSKPFFTYPGQFLHTQQLLHTQLSSVCQKAHQ